MLPDVKTKCSAVVAAAAEAGVGAAAGAAAASGARAGAGVAISCSSSGSTDSLGMLLTTGTHEQNVDTTPGCRCRAVCGIVCTCMTAGSGHVIMQYHGINQISHSFICYEYV